MYTHMQMHTLALGYSGPILQDVLCLTPKARRQGDVSLAAHYIQYCVKNAYYKQNWLLFSEASPETLFDNSTDPTTPSRSVQCRYATNNVIFS